MPERLEEVLPDLRLVEALSRGDVREPVRPPVARAQVELDQRVLAGVAVPDRVRPLWQLRLGDRHHRLPAGLYLVVGGVVVRHQPAEAGEQHGPELVAVLRVVRLAHEVEDRTHVALLKRSHPCMFPGTGTRRWNSRPSPPQMPRRVADELERAQARPLTPSRPRPAVTGSCESAALALALGVARGAGLWCSSRWGSRPRSQITAPTTRRDIGAPTSGTD